MHLPQGCPVQNSVQPRIIQMEMSPRAARSTRSSPGRCDPLAAHVAAVTDIWRRPGEPLQRNGRPPGPLAPLPRRPSEIAAESLDRQRNGHGPPELQLDRRTGEGQPVGAVVQSVRSEELSSPPAPTEQEESHEVDQEEQNEQEEREEREEQEEREEPSETEDLWREPLRFIDDSSEAS